MEKTFEECCDEVAKKNEVDVTLLFVNLQAERDFYKEVSDLYCQSQKAKAWDEGFKANENFNLINPYKP